MISTILEQSNKEILAPRCLLMSFPKTQNLSITETGYRISPSNMYNGVVGLLSYRESRKSFSVRHYSL